VSKSLGCVFLGLEPTVFAKLSEGSVTHTRLIVIDFSHQKLIKTAILREKD
jgi:hypothetical protein